MAQGLSSAAARTAVGSSGCATRQFFNVVVAALANKIASTSWAVLAKGKAFDQFKWNPIETAAA
jgi:hypothetical protein